MEETNACECGLCRELDTDTNILVRFRHCFLMLSRYPYVPGHLLVVPYRPVANLYECNVKERAEMTDVLAHVQWILTRGHEACANRWDSINIGLNNGPHAGGSIPQHLHWHIVPRARSDLNFTRVTMDVGHGPSNREHVQFWGQYLDARQLLIDAFVDNDDRRVVTRERLNDDDYRPNHDVQRAWNE